MIFVDPREGSKNLVDPLRARGFEIDDSTELPADLYFVGKGIKGVPVEIGIEYKTIPDLVQSLRTERLQGHQLLEMRGVSEDQPKPAFDFCYLLVEGEPIYDRTGMLMRRAGRRSFKPLGMTVNELFKRLNTLHLNGGLNWILMRTQADSVRWIEALYQSWTDDDLDKHTSHIAIYTPPTLLKPTQFEQTIRTLPGVGGRVAKAAAKVFRSPVPGENKPSIRVAINANEDRWAAIETEDDKGKTRKFGLSNAIKLVEAVR